MAKTQSRETVSFVSRSCRNAMGEQVNDLAAEQKIYSCDCSQVYCTTGMMNREQRGTAAGLGLSQCHFDDLAWDRSRRLTA